MNHTRASSARVTDEQPIGIRGIGTALASREFSLEELASAGRLDSSTETLRGLGFEKAHVVSDSSEILELARQATREALEKACVDPEEIDLIIWVSALGCGHIRESQCPDPDQREALGGFCYSGSWLQDEFGFDRATVIGAAQQGCAGMFGGIRTARAILVAEPEVRNVLCVGVDALAQGASREILYNVISDAAVACVVSKEAIRDRWLGFHQITQGYYWDTPRRKLEIAAAYFPIAKAAIGGLLEKLGIQPDEIDLVIPNGIQAPTWPVLLELAGIPAARLHQSALCFGHTVAADNFLFLEELAQSGGLWPGARVLLFTYGFGSSWSAMLLEHQA